jgi:hypothetical protein
LLHWSWVGSEVVGRGGVVLPQVIDNGAAGTTSA